MRVLVHSLNRLSLFVLSVPLLAFIRWQLLGELSPMRQNRQTDAKMLPPSPESPESDAHMQVARIWPRRMRMSPLGPAPTPTQSLNRRGSLTLGQTTSSHRSGNSAPGDMGRQSRTQSGNRIILSTAKARAVAYFTLGRNRSGSK